MDSEGGIVLMKAKFRMIAAALALVLLLVPYAAMGEWVPASPAARLNVTASVLTPFGEQAAYGPAMPLSNAPDENRLWLKVPMDVFFSGRMALLIEDRMQEYASFDPASGSILENIGDAGLNLAAPSVSITLFDGMGNPVGMCYLYISSQDAPAEEMPVEQPTEVPVEFPVEAPTEAPVEFPVETPTEVPVEFPVETPTEVPVEQPVVIPAVPLEVTVRYLNEAGEPIAPDTTQLVQPGSNTIYPMAAISDEYELIGFGAQEAF